MLCRIKVYTGSSFLHLVVYVEDPSCRARTTTFSPLAGADGFIPPFRMEDYDLARQVAGLDGASFGEIILLSPVLKVAVGLAVFVGVFMSGGKEG